MKKVITKVCVDIMASLWEYTYVEELGIDPKDVINVTIYDGKVWLIYWGVIMTDQSINQ